MFNMRYQTCVKIIFSQSNFCDVFIALFRMPTNFPECSQGKVYSALVCKKTNYLIPFRSVDPEQTAQFHVSRFISAVVLLQCPSHPHKNFRSRIGHRPVSAIFCLSAVSQRPVIVTSCASHGPLARDGSIPDPPVVCVSDGGALYNGAEVVSGPGCRQIASGHVGPGRILPSSRAAEERQSIDERGTEVGFRQCKELLRLVTPNL